MCVGEHECLNVERQGDSEKAHVRHIAYQSGRWSTFPQTQGGKPHKQREVFKGTGNDIMVSLTAEDRRKRGGEKRKAGSVSYLDLGWPQSVRDFILRNVLICVEGGLGITL